jgi:hypothetical protein
MSEPQFDLGQLVFRRTEDGIEDLRLFQVIQILRQEETSELKYVVRGFQRGPQLVVSEHQLRPGTDLGERAGHTSRKRNAAVARKREPEPVEGHAANKKKAGPTKTVKTRARKKTAVKGRKASR